MAQSDDVDRGTPAGQFMGSTDTETVLSRWRSVGTGYNGVHIAPFVEFLDVDEPFDSFGEASDTFTALAVDCLVLDRLGASYRPGGTPDQPAAVVIPDTATATPVVLPDWEPVRLFDWSTSCLNPLDPAVTLCAAQFNELADLSAVHDWFYMAAAAAEQAEDDGWVLQAIEYTDSDHLNLVTTNPDPTISLSVRASLLVDQTTAELSAAGPKVKVTGTTAVELTAVLLWWMGTANNTPFILDGSGAPVSWNAQFGENFRSLFGPLTDITRQVSRHNETVNLADLAEGVTFCDPPTFSHPFAVKLADYAKSLGWRFDTFSVNITALIISIMEHELLPIIDGIDPEYGCPEILAPLVDHWTDMIKTNEPLDHVNCFPDVAVMTPTEALHAGFVTDLTLTVRAGGIDLIDSDFGVPAAGPWEMIYDFVGRVGDKAVVLAHQHINPVPCPPEDCEGFALAVVLAGQSAVVSFDSFTDWEECTEADRTVLLNFVDLIRSHVPAVALRDVWEWTHGIDGEDPETDD